MSRQESGRGAAGIRRTQEYRKRTKPKLGSLCLRYLFSRPVARQLSSAYMCLTSVFGMAASPSAAIGRVSEGGVCAAVGRKQVCLSDEVFARHRKRKQVDPLNYIEKLHYLSSGVLCWHYLFSRPVTRQLSSAYMCLTSVFGMGTGGPSLQSKPTILLYIQALSS